MLHGELVTLRAPRRSDLADLQPILRDDVETVAAMDDAPWVPRSREMSEARFDKGLADDPAGDQVWLTVQIRDDPEEREVGEAGLWGIDLHRRHAHVGLVLGRAQRGDGLEADVLRVLSDYAFRIRGLHRLQIDTLAVNEAMIGLAASVGFRREGVLRDFDWFDGGHVDGVVLGLLAADWKSSPAAQQQDRARHARSGTEPGDERS